MKLDDEVCYCYHISLGKLVRFARRERPCRASQLSACLGAGTGCGWCIPMLRKIQEQAAGSQKPTEDQLAEIAHRAPGDYAEARAKYLRSDEKHSF